jgi:hypothetical protein
MEDKTTQTPAPDELTEQERAKQEKEFLARRKFQLLYEALMKVREQEKD